MFVGKAGTLGSGALAEDGCEAENRPAQIDAAGLNDLNGPSATVSHCPNRPVPREINISVSKP